MSLSGKWSGKRIDPPQAVASRKTSCAEQGGFFRIEQLFSPNGHDPLERRRSQKVLDIPYKNRYTSLDIL